MNSITTARYRSRGRTAVTATTRLLLLLTVTLLACAPAVRAQIGNGDPYVICEDCNADPPSGSPPGAGSTVGSGTVTATNSSGQTMQFPIAAFPPDQVSNLNPMSPENLAKFNLPLGYSVVGQNSAGDPVVKRPDGTYMVIQLSQGQVINPGVTGQDASAQPTPPIPDTAGEPSGQMNGLLNHVRELVPYIRRQIEAPLLKKFYILAMILASLVLLFSFIRVIRENDGASRELYYWFGRAVICMMIFTSTSVMLSYLYKVGSTLTTPIVGDIEEKRIAFNDQYKAFIHGHYVVRDDKMVFVQPMYIKPNEQYGWVGILTDQESGKGQVSNLKSIENATNLTGWPMPKLFFGMNIARGILEAGDIFLILLGGFIMIALKLCAPFMVAAAIDQKLAQRISYPFLTGVIVFMLVFPVVRDVITLIAYTVGSFGLSLYNGFSPYAIDSTTAMIIKNNAYEPVYVIILTLVTMAIASLMLWASPYLAYRIATGQVFEAISSTASGWMAAIVGSAIELTGLKEGAALQRQAENTQTQGGYQAELTRSKGALEASNLGAQARKISGLASIEANRQTSQANIAAGAATARGSALAGANFTIASTRAQVGDSNRQLWARTDQAVNQAKTAQGADSVRIAGEGLARKVDLWGASASGVFTGVPIASNAAQGIVTPLINAKANTVRNQTQNQANNQLAFGTTVNELDAADRVEKSQFRYRDDMKDAAQNQYEANVGAINEGAAIASGGVNRGAAISAGGVNKAYALEVKANETQFSATREAAGQVKDATIEAAQLRELSTIVSGFSRDLARRVEEGMRQRF